MKRISLLIVILVLTISICGCGEQPKAGVLQKYLDVVGTGEVEMQNALGSGKQNIATVNGKKQVISYDFSETYNEVKVNVAVGVKAGKVVGVYFYPAQNGFDWWAEFITQNVGKGPDRQEEGKYTYNLGGGYKINLNKNSNITAFEIIK